MRTSSPLCGPVSWLSSPTKPSSIAFCGCLWTSPRASCLSPEVALTLSNLRKCSSSCSDLPRGSADVDVQSGSLQARSPVALQPKDYKSELKPIWCPGCGDFGVLQALYRALSSIGRQPHEIAFISGIGCSSRIPGYTTAYG